MRPRRKPTQSLEEIVTRMNNAADEWRQASKQLAELPHESPNAAIARRRRDDAFARFVKDLRELPDEIFVEIVLPKLLARPDLLLLVNTTGLPKERSRQVAVETLLRDVEAVAQAINRELGVDLVQPRAPERRNGRKR